MPTPLIMLIRIERDFMARILENTQGGRRMIRLSAEDVLAVISRVQMESRQSAATTDHLKESLASRPFYLPEEAL